MDILKTSDFTNDLEIVDYIPEYQPNFKSLNLSWIQRYFEVEEIDHNVLSDPETYIYKDGGTILMAKVGGNIVGTVALKRCGESTFELTKMAVDPAFQGGRIGYHLGVAAIEKAKAMGALDLLLYSQTVLAPAIKLYRKLGFKEVTLESSKYKRCNIKMKISFVEKEYVHAISSQFKMLLDDASAKFREIPQVTWHEKPYLNKWSKKEILGHMIDSASNNHQRIVRIQYLEDRNFPGYDQDKWVAIQNYQNYSVPELLQVWYFMNLHLFHAIENLQEDTLSLICVIDKEKLSFKELIESYIDHFQHHMKQILINV